jgi:hypothetical protein
VHFPYIENIEFKGKLPMVEFRCAFHGWVIQRLCLGCNNGS